MTPNPEDYQIINLYREMIQMSSGISDFYQQGVGGAGGNDTASGISQVIQQSGYNFKLLIRNIEQDILQPMMEMVASMIQQFGSDEMEYSVTNEAPGIPKYGRVKLETLIGSYDFDFVGANYATGKVVKQRNLMAFYNIAMQSPYCNQPAFLREIARAMEIPFANRLLKSDQDVQQQMMASQQAQMEQAILHKLLDFESKALVAGIRKPEPNKVTDHALEVQQAVEEYLQEQAGAPMQHDPMHANQRHEGRPAQAQHEGPIPGGNAADQMRSFAQNNGRNALGLGGAYE